jgi:hypothetical protein
VKATIVRAGLIAGAIFVTVIGVVSGRPVYNIAEEKCAFGLWCVYPCQKIAQDVSGSAFLVLCQSVVHVGLQVGVLLLMYTKDTRNARQCQAITGIGFQVAVAATLLDRTILVVIKETAQ